VLSTTSATLTDFMQTPSQQRHVGQAMTTTTMTTMTTTATMTMTTATTMTMTTATTARPRQP
jgi:hypothetical protein